MRTRRDGSSNTRQFAALWLCCAAFAVLMLLFSLPGRGAEPADSKPYFSPGPDRIDLNHAPAAELQCLPGIGEKRAQSILEYRMENGFFSDLGELELVPGISARTAAKAKPFLALKAET